MKRDEALKQLVLAVNGSTLEVPIVLHVGTLVIKGTLVAGSVYQEGLAVRMQEYAQAKSVASTDEDSPTFVRELKEIVGDGKIANVEYICLRDAFIHGGGDSVRVQWWRGLIDDVQSFGIPPRPQKAQIPPSTSGYSY